MAAMSAVEVDSRDVDRRTGGARLVEQRPSAGQVADDPRRIASDVVDVGRRDLDQALEQRPLGEVRRSHPGRLQQLVCLEEIAPPIGRQSGLHRRDPLGRRQWPVRLGPPVASDHDGAVGHTSSASGRRPANPASWPCQNPTVVSPRCQHSQT